MIKPLRLMTGLLAGLVYIQFGLVSCGKESTDMFDCNQVPTYTTDIRPILNASCAKSGCHDAITVQDGVNLSTYTTARALSQEERFLGVIQHKSGFPPMPFDGPQLPQSQIELLTCWAQNGAPE